MFCTFCNEFIKGNFFVYDDEEYCSKECLTEAKGDIEGDIDKYMNECEEIEEYN